MANIGMASPAKMAVACRYGGAGWDVLAEVVVVQGGKIIVHQTERVDHFHGGGALLRLQMLPDALVGKTNECRAKPLAGASTAYSMAAASSGSQRLFQCPSQEGITRITMGLQYGRHNAIVGCQP